MFKRLKKLYVLMLVFSILVVFTSCANTNRNDVSDLNDSVNNSDTTKGTSVQDSQSTDSSFSSGESNNINNNEDRLLSLLNEQSKTLDELLSSGQDKIQELKMYLTYECEEIEFLVPSYWTELRDATENNEETRLLFDYFLKDLDQIRDLLNQQSNEEPEDEKEDPYTRFADAKIGDTFIFGNFTYVTSEGEPVEWLVLDKQDDKLLVISKYIIDSPARHLNKGDVWATSSWREYLNEAFYSSTFSEDEQEYIITSNVSTPTNPYTDKAGGDDTVDKIFLLSVQEVELYFPDNASRITEVTDSSRVVASQNNTASWWLRSVGPNPGYMARVDGCDGKIVGYNDYYGADSVGFRPAMWLTLEP